MEKSSRRFSTILLVLLMLTLVPASLFFSTRIHIPENQMVLVQETEAVNDAAAKRSIERIRRQLDRWEPDVDKVLDELASLKGSALLTYCLAKDAVWDTDAARQRIDTVIMTCIENDAIRLNRRIENILADLLRELGQSKAGMLEKILSEASHEFDKTYAQLNGHIGEVSQGIAGIAVNTTIDSTVLAGTAIGGRTILSQARSVLSPVVKRFLATQAASGATAIADGPIPVLDAVALVIEVCGTGWAAYDLYKAQVKLENKIRNELIRGVENHKARLLNLCIEKASDMTDRQNKNNLALVGALNQTSGGK